MLEEFCRCTLLIVSKARRFDFRSSVKRPLLARMNAYMQSWLRVRFSFAAQYLGCERELGLGRKITNVNGSGIGPGYSVGSPGCCNVVTLLYAMKHQGKNLGLATICGGGGVSMACALETL